jgi:hypothetical protein
MTPNPEYAGKRLGVRFEEGEGRTMDILKAFEFSEIYGYDVVAPTGAERWEATLGMNKSAGERAEWSTEGPPKTALEEANAARPVGQFVTPRKVKDEIAEEKAFKKAI